MMKFIQSTKEGYAVLIVGVLFAVGMVVVSTQIARQTVTYQRTVGNTLEENVATNFADNVANKVLSRLMSFGSGYYELGNTLDFSNDGNEVRRSLEMVESSFGNGDNDVVMDYDFIGASIVPVPTAYSFSGDKAGNNFEKVNILNASVQKGVVDQNTAYYDFYDRTDNVVCDPLTNFGKEQGDYNIFKRVGGDAKQFQAVGLPNFRCDSVYVTPMNFGTEVRNGTQRVVTNRKGAEPANFYYTVPALGTGDAGSECEVHHVEFMDTWNGGGEYIDPLDHPCNWNVMDKGETVKFGLSGYSIDEVRETTRGAVGAKATTLATSGTNLEQDVLAALSQSYYKEGGVKENDVLVLRIRLRCSDGSNDCHPTDRYEFFDREFLNEFDNKTHAECTDDSGQQICSHSYSQLAQHNLNNPEFDFTPLVFGYGLVDDGRFLPMRGDYNLGEQRKERMNFIFNSPISSPYTGSDILEWSKNGRFSMMSVNKLRASYISAFASFYSKTKNSRSSLSFLNSQDYQFSYDNQNKISNILVNNLEFPYQEQGFRFDYENDYFHLYLLDTEGQDDLKNPEFVLQALSDFIEVIDRQEFQNNDDAKTYTRLEYQIVSDRVIGLDEGYLVYDFGYGKKINKNKYDVSGISDTGFVNVSN